MKELHIFYDKNCKAKVPPVKEALEGVFGLDTTEENLFNLAEGTYDTNRMQYDASNLLNYLIRYKTRSESLCLWLISEDIYVPGMNFVFGVAQPGKAAVISTHRLDSFELIKKEAIHEMGHVLWLHHCNNYCVMQFSNSLYEAKKKPAKLCERCKAFLDQRSIPKQLLHLL
jgi:archaemetzincin